MKNNFKKNFIWNTIGVFSISLTSFVYSLILVRLCELSISGVWSYAFAVACTAVTIASFGGRTYQVTDVKNELTTYTYVKARYLTVSLMFGIMLIFTALKGFNLNKSLILILLCLFKFFEELSDVYYGILQKNDRLYVVGKSMFFKSFINMIIFFVAILLTKELLIAVIVILINNFLFFYFYDRRSALKLGEIEKNTNKKMFIKYFKSNLVICIVIFLSTYLVNCPKYLMEIFLSEADQGIYNLLALPATAVTLIGSFIINPMLVGISEDYKDNKIEKIKKTAFKMTSIILAFGIVALIGGYFLGPLIMRIVYGLDLNLYLTEFCIMILGCTFYTVSSILSLILISARKIMPQLIYNVSLAVFSYILCYFLVKNYSLQGAVYSYIIIMFIRFIIYVLMILFMKENKNEKKSFTLISK